MKRILTLFAFTFLATLSFAAYPVGSKENIDGSALGWSDSEKVWRPVAVDSTGAMQTSAGGTIIASISVDTSDISGSLIASPTQPENTAANILSGIKSSLATGGAVITSVDAVTNAINSKVIPLSFDATQSAQITTALTKTDTAAKDSVQDTIASAAASIIGKMPSSSSSPWDDENVGQLLDAVGEKGTDTPSLIDNAKNIADRLYDSDSSMSAAKMLHDSLTRTNTSYPTSIVDTIASSTNYIVSNMGGSSGSSPWTDTDVDNLLEAIGEKDPGQSSLLVAINSIPTQLYSGSSMNSVGTNAQNILDQLASSTNGTLRKEIEDIKTAIQNMSSGESTFHTLRVRNFTVNVKGWAGMRQVMPIFNYDTPTPVWAERKFIEIQAPSDDTVFFVAPYDPDGTPPTSAPAARRCKGKVTLKLDSGTQDPWTVNSVLIWVQDSDTGSTPYTFTQTEGY